MVHAELATGSCGANGENCTLLELNMANGGKYVNVYTCLHRSIYHKHRGATSVDISLIDK